MIVVCEPQCRSISHEKVNSGFLTALRLAYPDDELRLYAHASHNEALRDILSHDKVAVDRLDYRSLTFEDSYSFRGLIFNYRALRRLFLECKASGVHRVFFLSFSPALLHLVKRLKAEAPFRDFQFSLVLHGDFENIAGPSTLLGPAPVSEPLGDKLRSLSLGQLPRRAAAFVRDQARYHYGRGHRALFDRLFRTKEQLLWRSSPDFHYIALSPHIAKNAAQYIDTDALDIRTVMMPINLAPIAPAPRNDKLRFATFGYGDVPALLTVARHLSALGITRDYEVRVIGMGHRAFAAYPHFTTPSTDRRLSRAEMETHARDIDIFLVLYGPDRYRLSCSGSILEALSYVKPVLHLPNACIDEFDRADAPIGFRCADLSALAAKMKALIEAGAAADDELALRRHNLLALREHFAMTRLAQQVREATTFAGRQ